MGRWSVLPATELWIGPVWTRSVFTGSMRGPPVARAFLAVLRAMAIACFCGYFSERNIEMLRLMVFWDLPLASGMASPDEVGHVDGLSRAGRDHQTGIEYLTKGIDALGIGNRKKLVASSRPGDCS